MQTLAAYTESFCIITPGSFLYRRVLYKYVLVAVVKVCSSSIGESIGENEHFRAQDLSQLGRVANRFPDRNVPAERDSLIDAGKGHHTCLS